MAITWFNIKKWTLMIFKKSELHAPQILGKYIIKDKIHGYYNDLTNKVRFHTKHNDINTLPLTKLDNGESVHFTIAIFQYALGLYDLFLETSDTKYIFAFLSIANWALEKQEEAGGWLTFDFSTPENPYSCMSQGEGSSVLIRAYSITNNEKYLMAAKKSIDFMISFTTLQEKETNNMIFLEYTNKSPVLNGWIFAIFGLYDLSIMDKQYVPAFENSIEDLSRNLHLFDIKYWSTYNMSRSIIASPFYHKLHMAQLEALHLISENQIFYEYFLLFNKYNKNIFYKIKAFLIKARQKIKE